MSYKEIRSEEPTAMGLATEIERIAIELDGLISLLQVYSEHREAEIAGLDHNQPYTTAAFLARQSLGGALVNCITDKTAYIHDLADIATQRGYELVRATSKGGTAEK